MILKGIQMQQREFMTLKNYYKNYIELSFPKTGMFFHNFAY